MSDELVVNGGAEDEDVEIATKDDDSETMNQTIQKLMQKLVIIEQEKQELVNDGYLAAEKIKQLEDEIQSSESDKRALSSIAARAAELETEVSRLQHDLISSMSEGQESNAEKSELTQLVENLKKSESEKTTTIDVLEKERNLLLERLNEVTEKLKESENQVLEFHRKIEGFKTEEINLKREKLKVEEEGKAKITEKENQIQNLNRMIDEFQSVIVKNRADIEKSEKEKEELEIGKNDVEALLKKSERKVEEMKSKIDQLQTEMESYDKINCILKDKVVENTHGIVVDGDEKRSNLNVDWPVIAASAGAVALLGVVYLRHVKFWSGDGN